LRSCVFKFVGADDMTVPITLFITGVSSGFGRALAQEALQAGHRVVGTVRSEPARQDFEQLAAGRAIGRVLDVNDFEATRVWSLTSRQPSGRSACW
jgi:NAD(P)-dependent dehydrogenase (short-subunit alcohol dehydrogenase family)